MNIGKLRRLRDPRWLGIAIARMCERTSDPILREASGVIHVGANTGDERAIYAKHGLSVAWIEPIHEVFLTLSDNLRPYAGQTAYEYLVTDKDDQLYQFHIANNGGLSSSIFELHQHKDIWPDVHYTKSVTLRSVTLASLVKREGIDIEKCDALVMDTQGSELLVLKGAERLVRNFKFVKTEAADFEAYKGCARLQDINEFLCARGFRELHRSKFAIRRGGGSYYNVVFGRF
jgi:FkbM family methyltransferase